jgi:diadenosine tetraphosphate (Ap4A) HIT family hydrolase
LSGWPQATGGHHTLSPLNSVILSLSKDQFSLYDVGMAFSIPDHLVIKKTEHWIVNHRIESTLPGYLMVGSRRETNHLVNLPPAALAELGPLLAEVQQAVIELFRPAHLYVGRYGHTLGHSIHFHVIPIYPWVRRAFDADARYRVLRSFYTPGVPTSDPDGAELTLYVWREFCESRNTPPIRGPSVEAAIGMLRKVLDD